MFVIVCLLLYISSFTESFHLHLEFCCYNLHSANLNSFALHLKKKWVKSSSMGCRYFYYFLWLKPGQPQHLDE